MESTPTQHPDVAVSEISKVEFRSPIFLAGFVGAGLVGSISAEFLVQELKLKEIGYVKSRYIPPAAVFEGGRLRHPFTLHASADGKLCVALCELPLGSLGLYQIASALLDWAESKKASEVVVIDELGVEGVPQKYQAFCAAEKDRCSELKAKGMEILEKGFIFGLAGCILNECLSRKITGVAVLVPASMQMPDPGAAAEAIGALNKLYGLNVNVSQLKTEEKKIKERLKELVEQYQKVRQAEEKREVPENLYA